jgi:integrase
VNSIAVAVPLRVTTTWKARVRELRDRAILLFGFAGAFRRSELVALNLEDIEWSAEAALTGLGLALVAIAMALGG